MKKLSPPFKFDLRSQLSKARRNMNKQVGNITINLPFLSFSINPNNLEEKVAKEIIIRMSNKRILNAFECCDNCINQALASLQDIRKFLVDKQVELSNAIDSPLYLLAELQLEAIRQFLTFEQRLNQDKSFKKERYFAALELLRSHLHRCLKEVAKIANIEIPNISKHMRYDEAWQLEAYEQIENNL